MANNTKNKHGALRQAKAKAKFYSNVSWQLVLLGAMGLASYKLFHSVSGLKNYGMADYITIVAATALAISAVFRVAQLVSNEANHVERAE